MISLKELGKYAVWVLVLGGLLWGYEGLTGSQLQEMLVGGTISDFVEILVGVSALYVGYEMLTGKKGR